MDDEAAEADALADMVNLWSVKRIDPERFHLDRDQIAKRLRRLAEQLRSRARNGGRPTTTWRPNASR